MKKKLLVFVMAAVMTLTAAGCAKPAAQTSGDAHITINLWHNFIDTGDENRVAIDAYIAEYEAAHQNVKIEQHILEDSTYKDKMLTEFSGSAASVDVFAYWGAGRAGDLISADKLLRVEDYLSADQISSIKKGADDNFRYDGKLYGLPMASWMMLLYCNTRLFEQNNVKLPTTYDEWLTACKQFDAAGIIPLALGGGVDDGWLAAFAYEALVNSIVGSDATIEVLNNMSGFADNPGFREAAAKVIEMNAAGAFGKSPLEIDEVTANVQYLSGAAAMSLEGSWFTQAIYTDEDSVVADVTKALPIPMVPGGNGKDTDYVGGFIDGYFVNKATKNPEVAVDFAYGLALAQSTHQHETGEGFTAYNTEVDESNLFPIGVETATLANTMLSGVAAWDTLLPGDLADIHIDACQSLLAAGADVEDFMEAHQEIFN